MNEDIVHIKTDYRNASSLTQEQKEALHKVAEEIFNELSEPSTAPEEMIINGLKVCDCKCCQERRILW